MSRSLRVHRALNLAIAWLFGNGGFFALKEAMGSAEPLVLAPNVLDMEFVRNGSRTLAKPFLYDLLLNVRIGLRLHSLIEDSS
jgi:hypothetical protein